MDFILLHKKYITFLKYIIKLFVLNFGSTHLGCQLGSSRTSIQPRQVRRARQPRQVRRTRRLGRDERAVNPDKTDMLDDPNG